MHCAFLNAGATILAKMIADIDMLCEYTHYIAIRAGGVAPNVYFD